MPHQDFFFTVHIADQAEADAMLRQLSACVLDQVGFSGAAASEMLDGMRDVMARGAVEGFRQCEVHYGAEGDQFTVVVSFVGGREWRHTRGLPPRG